MRPRILAASLTMVFLASACTGTTEIVGPSTPGASADADADADAEDTIELVSDAAEAPAESTPAPVPAATPTTSDLDEPVDDGWADYDLEVFTISLPSEWDALTKPAQVAPVIAAAEDDGAEFSRQAVSQFEALLKSGEAIIGLGPLGDNVNAFRQFGLASSLIEHELIVEELTFEFTGFAEDVRFTSEPRMIKGTPGVLVRGSYGLEGQDVSMYQFITHQGTHLYFVTLTLFSGDDPKLATELFRSFSIG